MSEYSDTETTMWSTPIREDKDQISDAEINSKYSAGDHRIVTETNREKIPNFVEALKRPNYMEIMPFYQRRKRWDRARQSLLIESFIMNVPVPPLFLYEKDFNRYEVMDGQQRITALKSFYEGEFKLSGLSVWKELNGKSYSQLPSQVRSGLDRRSISYIVVLRESTPNEEEATFLRQVVFERLNTGGVKLEHQEIRNCLFQGKFNEMLLKLSRTDYFRKAWQLPLYTSEENSSSDAEIKDKAIYKKMEDLEIVLRFFALRHANHYTRGMHGFLDLYMARAQQFSDEDIVFLSNLFNETIGLAYEIYGERVFIPFNKETEEWENRPQKAFYDSVMVSLSKFTDKKDILLTKKEEIVERTKALFIDNESGTFTGRGNTKQDIIERIGKYEKMIKALI